MHRYLFLSFFAVANFLTQLFFLRKTTNGSGALNSNIIMSEGIRDGGRKSQRDEKRKTTYHSERKVYFLVLCYMQRTSLHSKME